MTTSFLLLLATSLPSSGFVAGPSPFEQALTHPPGYVVQGQPYGTYAATAPLTTPPMEMNGYYPPAFGGGGAAYGPVGDPFAAPMTPGYPSPIIQDPWQGGAISPFGPQVMAPDPGMYTFGPNGPQPHRFGWTSRYDFTYMPGAKTRNPNLGHIEIFGIDIEKVYTTPIGMNWVFSIAPQFNYRSFEGPPNTVAINDIPGGAYRFGLGLTLQTPTVNGWALEGGFNPSLGSDFRSSLTSDAYMWDAHLVAFWRVHPTWMWAFGAAYWDRVDDIIIPYAGAVWTPNPNWEFRLLFPKPRISVFLGAPHGMPTWLYVAGEYHVEAYELNPKLAPTGARVQFSDWRVTGGLRWETSWVTSFIEGGWVLGREVKGASPAGQFDISSGFIGRLGFRY